MLSYRLQNVWRGTDFNQWKFFKGKDPTNGVVDYSQGSSLIHFPNGKFQISVNPVLNNSTQNVRGSVRISTPFYFPQTKIDNIETGFNGGVFVADIAHLPSGKGVWPAFWMTSVTGSVMDASGKNTGRTNPAWPTWGEIDIIEQVNNASSYNQVNLHTQSLYPNNNGKKLGNYYQYPVLGPYGSFGPIFNQNGGGVFILNWVYNGNLTHYFVPRNVVNQVPSLSQNTGSSSDTWTDLDLSVLNDQFKVVEYRFQTTDSPFKNQRLILNTTLCGDWAGKGFPDNSSFSDQNTTSCTQYVLGESFDSSEAYWLINYISVFSN